MVFLILSVISLKQNFKSEYNNYLKRMYPLNTIFISLDTYNLLSNETEIRKYDNYSFMKDNVEYLPLLPKDETILSNTKYIQRGKFPSNSSEILVNNEYLEDVMNENGFQLNDSIFIGETELKIVGIINSNEIYLEDIYNTNYYYNLTHSPQVFIPYEKIKKISTSTPTESKMVMVTFKNLYSDDDLYELIIAEGNQNCWNEKLNNISYSLNVFLDIFFISLAAIFIILFIFIANQILLNLLYRKRELGYLQLFGITKKRIKRILFIEYSLKYMPSLLSAIILHCICAILINKYLSFNFVISFQYLILITLISLLYCYFVMFIPLKIFLKKSIKALIYE